MEFPMCLLGSPWGQEATNLDLFKAVLPYKPQPMFPIVFPKHNPNLNLEEAWKSMFKGLKKGPKRLVGVIVGDEILPNYIGDHNKPWNKDPYETTSSSQISSYIGIIKKTL